MCRDLGGGFSSIAASISRGAPDEGSVSEALEGILAEGYNLFETWLFGAGHVLLHSAYVCWQDRLLSSSPVHLFSI